MKQFFFGRINPVRTRRDARTSPMRSRARRSLLERLEDRNLLTGMPYGALPDDTAEYMLGDVYVNVVLMESDSSMAPFKVTSENWTASEISDVKSRISAGLQWWEDTLDAMPNVRDGLLKFTMDWTHADNPVHTGHEPIKETSQDFAIWIYDFLGNVGFTQTGNFLTDLRAYNNAQRLAHNANWSFTIFVVDDSNDLANDFPDPNGYDGRGRFALGSAFTLSFAYAGGNAFVMPAGRPASTVTHETGHIFWAFDEYNDPHLPPNVKPWEFSRGYYNTQNSNSSLNPAPGFEQADSIMASFSKLDAAYAAHTSSIPSLETIGWKDSGGEAGIFDVLDVKFSLSGTGKYNSDTSTFKFIGKSQVRTLANKNTEGLKNDITINQIDRAEYSLDGGAWTTIGTYHKYTVDLNLNIFVTPGTSQIKIRTVDDRTGVTSVEYVADLNQGQPQPSPQPGVGGTVFNDRDGNGTWDISENGLAGWLVQLVNQFGQPLNLRRQIEPDSYHFGALLNFVAAPEVTLSAVGGDVANANVNARPSISAGSGGKVFFNNSISDSAPTDTWTAARQLRIDFTPGVSEVNITAISKALRVSVLTVGNGAAGGANEVQQIHLIDPTAGGTFTITYEGETTDNIAYDASASTVKTALEALSKIGVGNVAVTGASPDWRVTFQGSLKAKNVSQMTGTGTDLSVGRLEIYNSSGVLLDRYTTGVLGSGMSEVMKLVRPQGDIAYAIASGHAGTKVVLDTLEWGAASSTVTNSFGYYNLPELAAGTYRVAVVAKPFYSQTFPSLDGFHLVDMPDAQAGASQVNFGFLPVFNPWRNPDEPLDVNYDGAISAIDALSGINYINTHDATIPLPAVHPDGEKFYDVNNDGYVSAVDILQVINEINKPVIPSFSNGSSSGGSSFVGSGSSGTASGERDTSTTTLVPGKDLAAQYYAQNPLQVLQVPGAAGCSCGQCTAIAEVAAGRVNTAAAKTTVATPAARSLELQSFAAVKKQDTLQTRAKVVAPHIDGDLLHTLASAKRTSPAQPARRGRK